MFRKVYNAIFSCLLLIYIFKVTYVKLTFLDKRPVSSTWYVCVNIPHNHPAHTRKITTTNSATGFYNAKFAIKMRSHNLARLFYYLLFRLISLDWISFLRTCSGMRWSVLFSCNDGKYSAEGSNQKDAGGIFFFLEKKTFLTNFKNFKRISEALLVTLAKFFSTLIFTNTHFFKNHKKLNMLFSKKNGIFFGLLTNFQQNNVLTPTNYRNVRNFPDTTDCSNWIWFSGQKPDTIF